MTINPLRNNRIAKLKPMKPAAPVTGTDSPCGKVVLDDPLARVDSTDHKNVINLHGINGNKENFANVFTI